MYKVIIVHPDMQHSFKTAKALKDAGFLFKYITTVYDKSGSYTNMLMRFLKGNFKTKLGVHKTAELSGDDVVQFCELFSLVLLFVRRFDRSKRFSAWLEKIKVEMFNRKAARYCISNKVDAVIAFDTVSASLLKKIKKTAPHIKCIVDMSAPHFEYMDMIFREDFGKNKGACYELAEQDSSMNRYRLANSVEEKKLADAFLAASKFTARSLREFDVAESKIYICRYGAKLEDRYTENTEIKEKLHCIFVGNVTAKKGIHYFLNAIDSVGYEKYHFTVIGAYDAKNPILADYFDKIKFTGHITKQELEGYYKEADVMVFPSLCDGFGFAVLEALSYGVPVICSTNAGAADTIKDGYNGFKIPAQSARDIEEKLNLLCEDREILDRMKKNASTEVCEYTWERYNSEIKNMIHSVCKEG